MKPGWRDRSQGAGTEAKLWISSESAVAVRPWHKVTKANGEALECHFTLPSPFPTSIPSPTDEHHLISAAECKKRIQELQRPICN